MYSSLSLIPVMRSGLLTMTMMMMKRMRRMRKIPTKQGGEDNRVVLEVGFWSIQQPMGACNGRAISVCQLWFYV